MTTGFIANHPGIESSCGPDAWTNKTKGRIFQVQILLENKKICLVETLDDYKNRVMVAKWPMQHWGKLRGIFKTREDAQDYLDRPAPRFDDQGNSLNKISKSDQKNESGII